MPMPTPTGTLGRKATASVCLRSWDTTGPVRRGRFHIQSQRPPCRQPIVELRKLPWNDSRPWSGITLLPTVGQPLPRCTSGKMADMGPCQHRQTIEMLRIWSEYAFAFRSPATTACPSLQLFAFIETATCLPTPFINSSCNRCALPAGFEPANHRASPALITGL